ncbi:hypothetical protein SAMD00019534_022670 [Acytostelium subglobosum LB1]|uniref:hypothetical protein n=1 Tax=Acytostelium subglobosum LB1 TaxID=1410327 RepID=UPI000644E146|nr:hypothetical protein SAMD00019534_022670 [Acytostelium subglobosum LB1]GAM19092.1 hypothetical protein SAMD00019534_022670 [Acytostelium subglobosum LB1]|eukprot:XP_012757019.1 hypothetical protein SAMD00019534_022670 [Acytostelium subglobosum LB1]
MRIIHLIGLLALVTLCVTFIEAQNPLALRNLGLNGNSDAALRVAYDTWARAYNKGEAIDLPRSTYAQRNTNVFGWNNGRQRNSYWKQANSYSDTSYNRFADTHLGANQRGFDQVTATSSPSKYRNRLYGGRLAGVIIGSVFGGVLILLGTISSIIAWRRHVAKRRATVYGDYRSNFRTNQRNPVSNADYTAPPEFYRESHRHTLNQGYINETNAAERFHTENLYPYNDRERLVPSAVKTVDEVVVRRN